MFQFKPFPFPIFSCFFFSPKLNCCISIQDAFSFTNLKAPFLCLVIKRVWLKSTMGFVADAAISNFSQRMHLLFTLLKLLVFFF